MKKTILVTGGAGYLGSILVRKLLDKGYNVKVLDCLFFGNESIQELEKIKNFELIKGKIENIELTANIVKQADAVIHLAFLVGMSASNINPQLSKTINLISTKNLAELCNLYEVKNLIFASTCSVYGARPNLVLTENSLPKPLDYYSKHKLECEKAINSFNFPSTLLRFGTLFGLSSRMRFDLIINLFAAQAIQEKKIKVFGGDQKRPFLHVSDAADSIIYFFEHNIQGTYNILKENLSIKQLSEKIKKLSNCVVEYENSNIDNRDYCVSNSKMLNMGFTPKISIEDAFIEIKDAFETNIIKNYRDIKYHNYDYLLNSEEIVNTLSIET